MYLNKKSLKMLLLLNTGFAKAKFQFSFKAGIKVAAYKYTDHQRTRSI